MLSHIDNANNKVALLKPTSRLLSLFIRNNDKLLLRERLLNDVWVEHGLKASNNNLNNYVSGLRKSLAQFGVEDIIVTYPRQGFKFNALSIQQMDIKTDEINNDDYSETEIASTPPPKARLPNFRRSAQRLIMIMAACLVPFAAIVLYQNSTRISVYPLGNEQNCQIYTMRLGGGELASIKREIRQAGFNCQYQADVYYYDNMRNDGAEKEEQWLTYCPRASNSPCINNYINNKQP